MTVSELTIELKQYPQNMKVTFVTDFENTDDNGLCQVQDIENLSTQTYFDDQFGADNDETILMLY
jgi:hypothetical protein